MSAGVIQELQTGFAPVHSKWEWAELYTNINKFQWVQGRTPFSNYDVVFIASFAYLAIIGILWYLMKNRAPYSIGQVQAYHNLFLCLWSLVMFLGTVYDWIIKLTKDGFFSLNCATSSSEASGRLYYWVYIYYISKFYELLDTVIVVLRKKELTFLHVYHHSVVMLNVWLWLQYSLVFATWGVMWNTGVHIIMYHFYYLTSIGKKDLWWKKYITTIQIVQFAISFILSIPFVYYYTTGYNCLGFGAYIFSIGFNLSLLYLFSGFFKKTYNKKNK